MTNKKEKYTEERLKWLEDRLQALSDEWEEHSELCSASVAIQDILDGLDPLSDK